MAFFEPASHTPYRSEVVVVAGGHTFDLTGDLRVVALWVGGAGNVVGRLEGDSADVTFTGVPAGTYLYGRFTSIAATTTATNIVGLAVEHF